MTRFCLDLVFYLTIWAKQTCLFTRTLSSTKAWLDNRRKEGNNFALVGIWNETRDLREQFEEQDFSFVSKYKTQVSKQEELGTWSLHCFILQLPTKAW
jgi:hypothetical protein